MFEDRSIHVLNYSIEKQNKISMNKLKLTLAATAKKINRNYSKWIICSRMY